MTQKVRIKAWQETGDSVINMADRLGRQKLKKKYFAGQSVFLSPGGSLASSRMLQTCPETSFIHHFWNFLLKNVIFLRLARFFIPRNHVFWPFFGIF
jgi:hypothetical protein